MKYTINQLAEKVNQEIAKEQIAYQSDDKRMADELSVRRIRSYLSQGLLDKPLKEGNHAYFNDDHVEKLKALRLFNAKGLSDNSLKKMSLDSVDINLSKEHTNPVDLDDERLRTNALSMIDTLMKSNTNNTPLSASINNVQKTPLSIGAIPVTSLATSQYRNWQEIELDKQGKVFLKYELGYVIHNKEEILERIKTVLGL